MAENPEARAQEIAEKLSHFTALTIPVQVEVDVKHSVVNLEEAKRLLQEAKAINLGDCYCRKTNKNCDRPVNTCLVLNHPIEKVKERDESFRSITLEQALEMLEASHKAGLVHLAYRNKDGIVNDFCSCCECCCWFLGALKEYDYHDGVLESSHIAKHRSDTCIGCGVCVEKCPFDAWTASENGGNPALNEANCFGCGVCVSACPVDAIAFEPR